MRNAVRFAPGIAASPGNPHLDCGAVFRDLSQYNSEKLVTMVTIVDWSEDRVAALSDQDLKNLRVNAERKSAADLIAKCDSEIEKRNAAKPRKASKPRTELKEFEHDMSG